MEVGGAALRPFDKLRTGRAWSMGKYSRQGADGSGQKAEDY